MACVLHGQSSGQFDMATHLLQTMPSSHIKGQKVSGHVFYMSTPCRTIESAVVISQNQSYLKVIIFPA